MPVYEFKCMSCEKVHESFMKVKDLVTDIPCSSCGGIARRILSLSAVHGQNPPWINDTFRMYAQDDGEKPIETRDDFNAYCKDKGLIAGR